MVLQKLCATLNHRFSCCYFIWKIKTTTTMTTNLFIGAWVLAGLTFFRQMNEFVGTLCSTFYRICALFMLIKINLSTVDIFDVQSFSFIFSHAFAKSNWRFLCSWRRRPTELTKTFGFCFVFRVLSLLFLFSFDCFLASWVNSYFLWLFFCCCCCCFK